MASRGLRARTFVSAGEALLREEDDERRKTAGRTDAKDALVSSFAANDTMHSASTVSGSSPYEPSPAPRKASGPFPGPAASLLLGRLESNRYAVPDDLLPVDDLMPVDEEEEAMLPAPAVQDPPPMSGSADGAIVELRARTPWQVLGHPVVAADVLEPAEASAMLFCMQCGANAHRQGRSGQGLAARCLGPGHAGLKQQRSRLRRGLHPHLDVQLGPPYSSPAEMRAAWSGKLGVQSDALQRRGIRVWPGGAAAGGRYIGRVAWASLRGRGGWIGIAGAEEASGGGTRGRPQRPVKTPMRVDSVAA